MSTAPTPSRRTLLRAVAALPAAAVLLGETPGLLGRHWPPRPRTHGRALARMSHETELHAF